MLTIIVDAVVLMGLLKALNDDEMSFLSGMLLATGAAIATYLLPFWLDSLIGPVGLFIGLGLITLIVGAVLSAIYGIVLTRAFLIAVIFMAIHVAILLVCLGLVAKVVTE